MALISCNIFSHAIGINTIFNVILPQSGRDFQTLYLLHGYSDNHNAWLRGSGIERYAEQYKLAVIMPDAQKSFYSDFVGIKSGYHYWQYISEELINITRNMFRLSDKREDTFVAGLSMGGFGAFKCALNKPEIFSAGVSLSGALDSVAIANRHDNDPKEISLLLDTETLPGSINDLFSAAEKTSQLPDNQRPRLYQACGTEDFLYEENVRYRDFIRALNYDYTYEEGPGVHEWGFWDRYIIKALEWLSPKKASDE
ncbi:MAG: esterase family protein [Clostridiales bacterium]|jgi:S-formylglutathione hydrolase FrmB|nr:esterase family protein [Clostridiales bacterium]